MLFTTSHPGPVRFNSRLCEAIRKLYYHGYFSYLCNAHHLIHWGLINKDKQITLKGVRFVRGDIAIEKMVYVSPRFSNDPDPEILRGNSFIFMKDADAQV